MKKSSLLLALGVALLLGTATAPKAKGQVAVRVAVGAPVYVRPAPRVYVVPRPYVVYGRRVGYAWRPVYRRPYVGRGPVYYRHWHARRYVARGYWRR